MPKNHARKQALARIKNGYGVKHTCAIALLDHPDDDERETLLEYLDEYIDINTYREAVAYLEQEKSDPLNQLLCEECGWTNRMVCPECPGCGCYNGRCSGWRHQEDIEEIAAETGESIEADCSCGHYGDPHHCCECGAEGADYDYNCVCGMERPAPSEPESEPIPDPHVLEPQSAGGWGGTSPFPLSSS